MSDVIDFPENIEVPCPTCPSSGRPGWIVNNPDWPNQEGEVKGECYHRCPTCAGELTVALNELTGETHEAARASVEGILRAKALDTPEHRAILAAAEEAQEQQDKIAADEQALVRCPVCKESDRPGFVMINPEWPKGDLPCYEWCPECGGNRCVPFNQLSKDEQLALTESTA